MMNAGQSLRTLDWEKAAHEEPENIEKPESAAAGESAVVMHSELLSRSELAELRQQVRTLRDQNALFASMMEATTDAVFAKDLRGRYTFINDAGARSMGRNKEVVIGRTDWELFGAHDAAVTVARDSAVFNSGRTLVYEDAEEGPPSRVWLSTKGVLRDSSGVVCGMFGISRDITARHELEKEREREMAQRERMVSILGHDLANPVLAIRFRVQRMLADPATARVWGSSLQQVGECVDRMTRMVRDLMDFSRAHHALGIPCRPQETTLDEVLRMASSELEPICGPDGLKVEVVGDTRGVWDADRLAQVVANLVLNAVKYGARGEPVRVRAWDEGGEQHLEVHNLGAPIPPALLPHVFEPFRRGAYRADADIRGGGLGLGLYIVKEIVRGHGGSIGVSSTEAEGTTFKITLPRLRQP